MLQSLSKIFNIGRGRVHGRNETADDADCSTVSGWPDISTFRVFNPFSDLRFGKRQSDHSDADQHQRQQSRRTGRYSEKNPRGHFDLRYAGRRSKARPARGKDYAV